VLSSLELIAPVLAVAGNCDRHHPETAALPEFRVVEVGGVSVAVAHERSEVLNRAPASTRVYVFGHSHRASVLEQRDALLVNPGSASQARGAAEGVTVGVLLIGPDAAVSASIVPLAEVADLA
jgi:putative phosphoesterase